MKCFHHDDLDGHGAGAVVAMYEDNYDKSNFFEVNYVQELPIEKIHKDELVYFVDYSFSLNTVDTLREILKITNNLIWIDHHNSSLQMLEKNPDLKDIKGIRQDGISGAALAYMYLYNVPYEKLPLILKYVSDFDCFHLKYKNVFEFKYGMESLDTSPLSKLWVDLFKKDKGDDNELLDSIIDDGTIIKRYYDRTAEEYKNKNAYETEIDGHKALVLNRDGGSQLFGESYSKYDVLCIWHYDGENYVYSLYSDNKVDVSKIAEKYGGGGHKGASGCSSKTLLFK
jgi:oligoribonuclease NrnB/cAMP/cGMP phosphodiesterase (DHH superfamily)